MLAISFPPLGHIVDWPGFAGTEGAWYEFNKIALIYLFAVILTSLIFILGNKKQLIPTGAQNLAEISIEFIEGQIIEPAMGHTTRKWLPPFCLALFFFIFFCNIFEVIPVIQMPATARIALPMVLALMCYVLYHGAGIKEHGPLGYLKHSLIPPGVPVFLLPLVALIEFVSKFLVQPFSHTVRLFANLLAGHILLVTFAVLTAATFPVGVWPLPAFGMVFFVAFETLVSFLQAYVFTLLFGVYFGIAVSHEH